MADFIVTVCNAKAIDELDISTHEKMLKTEFKHVDIAEAQSFGEAEEIMYSSNLVPEGFNIISIKLKG